MNLLSLMLTTYSYFDPDHDGFCWLVRRKGLRSYREEHSLNANEETEFLGDILQEAHESGFHVQLMSNCGIWNPQHRAAPNLRAHDTRSTPHQTRAASAQASAFVTQDDNT